MKQIFVGYLAGLVSMLVIDGVWLYTMSKRFYARNLGHLMAETPSFVPVAIFYLIYAGALWMLVVSPAVQGNFSILKTFMYGALFGLVAYATYDLTNQATLRNWPVLVTVVDLAWGTLLTGMVATISFLIAKNFS